MKSPMAVRNARAPVAAPSVFVGRMIETMGRLRSQERTRLGHDQVLVEKLVFYVQIGKSHSNARYRINGSQRRRITRFVRPGLEVHGLGRANAHQDTQHFHIGGPLRQRRVKAVATLFNGRKVETRRVRDRL